MTDLETRLRALGDVDGSVAAAPSADDVRATVRRRRSRRRSIAGGVVASFVLVVGLGVWRSVDDAPQVTTGDHGASTSTTPSTAPPPTTTAPTPTSRTIGAVVGVTMTVTPATDLTDGQVVDVHIDGLDRLPSAILLICAGDVTADNARASCDPQALRSPGATDEVQVPATTDRKVAVGRTINILRSSNDPNRAAPYDCATEPAGCVLAAGPYVLPARAVLAPLSFRASPTFGAVATITPSTDLHDGQVVAVDVRGLRPNFPHLISLCRANDRARCDLYASTSATADGEGHLRADVAVWSSLYGFGGLIDCNTEPCVLLVEQESTVTTATVPLAFAAGQTTTVPAITIIPLGPYRDDQVVTLRGTGFRPGLSLPLQIGECPADKDTAKEERCVRPPTSSAVVVDPSGTFITTMKLTASSCAAPAGCVLGWIPPNATTYAKVPLVFVP